MIGRVVLSLHAPAARIRPPRRVCLHLRPLGRMLGVVCGTLAQGPPDKCAVPSCAELLKLSILPAEWPVLQRRRFWV